MGGKQRTNPSEGGKPKKGNGFAGRGPLEEIIAVAESRTPVSIEQLFEMVFAFAEERRKHHESIVEKEKGIREIYDRFGEPQRVKFLGRLYDRFAERYDAHMGTETNHYGAIRRVLAYAEPYLQLPIIDLSAGTGEPMKFAVELMGVRAKLPPETETDLTYFIHLNEISARMLELAERKLGKIPKTGFTDYSALTLPEHLKGRFRTVLCSQTFHIISEEDKLRYVESIRSALIPGGHAIIMEEDPFRITQTPSIEPVSLFLRSVVAPIKHPGKLIGLFTTHGFKKLEDRAVAPIDEHHSMRLHVFEKK